MQHADRAASPKSMLQAAKAEGLRRVVAVVVCGGEKELTDAV
jgi:hypothetical protein